VTEWIFLKCHDGEILGLGFSHADMRFVQLTKAITHKILVNNSIVIIRIIRCWISGMSVARTSRAKRGRDSVTANRIINYY
jgi:hypothetical protein